MSLGLATSEFDRLLAIADPQVDAYFGKTFYYRVAGQGGLGIAMQMVLTAHTMEAEESQGLFESWHGHAFEVASALLLRNGSAFRPNPGDEIAEPLNGGGFNIFEVRRPPGKRCYDPLDAEELKLLILTQYTRTEAPTR